MKTRTIVLSLLSTLALLAVGCAAPEEEEAGDESGAAITTPWEVEKEEARRNQKARVEELRVALDDAQAADFGPAGATGEAKAAVEKLLSMISYLESNYDVRLYSFAKTGKKAYVFESSTTTLRTFYLYDSVTNGSSEGTPTALGVCKVNTRHLLDCVTHIEGALMP